MILLDLRFNNQGIKQAIWPVMLMVSSGASRRRQRYYAVKVRAGAQVQPGSR